MDLRHEVADRSSLRPKGALMTDIDRILADLEHQLDVLEASMATGRPIVAPGPFAPPAGVRLTSATRRRADELQRRLQAAEQSVAGELERTRQELALTEGAPGAPRFLDTTF